MAPTTKGPAKPPTAPPVFTRANPRAAALTSRKALGQLQRGGGGGVGWAGGRASAQVGARGRAARAAGGLEWSMVEPS